MENNETTEFAKVYTVGGESHGIPATDPRHPMYPYVAPIVAGEHRFAVQHERNSRICIECGLLSNAKTPHRKGCPNA